MTAGSSGSRWPSMTGQRETGTWGGTGAGAGAAAGAGGAGGKGAGAGAAAVEGGAGARRGGAGVRAGGRSQAVTRGAKAGAEGAGAENKVCQLPSKNMEVKRFFIFKCNINPLQDGCPSTLSFLCGSFL